MELTGKCKEEFEKWYNEEQTYDLGDVYNGFYSRDLNMQYGVYVDFFDSVGFYISTKINEEGFEFSIDERNGRYVSWRKERPTLRTAAIEKANELFNK